VTTSAGEYHEVEAQALIRTFARIDFVGAVTGVVFVVLVNFVFVREPGMWLIVPFLVFTSAALWLSARLADRDEIFSALVLVAVGNWVAALAVAVMYPFLWPVMVLTVVMPLVLATPFLESSQLVPATAATAFVAGAMAIAGLLNDDGGVIPDLADELELLIVAGGLAAHMVPIAVIVWQNNRLQRGALERSTGLNDELVASEAHLAASRRRVVEAADRERISIERDLHDGAQQRLVALRFQLQQLTDRVDKDPEARELANAAVDEVGAAIEELRELANGIYPPVLEAGGLEAALGAVARRSPTRIDLDLAQVGRQGAVVESAVYFTALEAATNAAKHAPDSTVSLRLEAVTRDGRASLRLIVADDGPGFDADTARLSSGGLMNMADRIGAVEGTLDLASSPGEGTTVTAVVPVE